MEMLAVRTFVLTLIFAFLAEPTQSAVTCKYLPLNNFRLNTFNWTHNFGRKIKQRHLYVVSLALQKRIHLLLPHKFN
ncbi:hypothetical protein CHS0354_026561 [Potamilus streckersoni]|uniref:Uncharacterized protein n=1 Tax=Potamilus streckersoni TaxID=2493646 RepID=A0AAE0VI00_9BIVA|nr:hypothetical protein CHS0354_026561 [Potamilus streckersoni]